MPVFWQSHIVGQIVRGNIGENIDEYCGGKLRGFFTFMTLFALWLLMSGIYTSFQIFMGAVSVLLVVIILRRMDETDDAHVGLNISALRFGRYLAWLMIEIAKSNWAVTKIILSPTASTRQHLFTVPSAQKSDVAQVIFANSITLTPGTITVETENDHFLVHAVDFGPDDLDALVDMGRRVCATETGGRA